MSRDSTVDIEFSTSSSGEGDLTAGQRYIWDIIETLAPNDAHLNIAFPIHIGDGTSVSHVLAVLRRAIVRHDTLRSYFPRHASGEPYQRLDPSGAVSVTLRDVTADGDLQPETLRLVTELASQRFDTTQPGLLRCGVVTQRAQPRRLVLCFSHMLTDATGAWMLSQGLWQQLSSDANDQDAAAEERPWQPLDQLAYEQSEAGQRGLARSLAHWRAHLTTAPLDTAPAAEAASSPRYWHGSLNSPATTRASSRLAHRWKVSSNSVLLATAGLLIGDVSGEDAPLLMMRVSNRMPGPAQKAIGHYSQAVPIRFDLTTKSVSQLVRDVHRTALTAYRYGHYQPSELTALLAELRHTRGGPVDIFNTVNCIRQPERGGAQPEGEAADVPANTFSWVDKRENEAIKTFLYIQPDHDISLFADTAVVSPERIEGYLRGIERVLLEADGGEDSLPGIRHLLGP